MFALFSLFACSEYEFHSQPSLNKGSEEDLFAQTDALTDEEITEDSEDPVDYTVEFAEIYDGTISLEVQNIDIAFVLDTTGSMSEEAAALAREFSDIADAIFESVPNAAYGFATFDDYNYSSMGAGYDRPFYLHNQITTDLARIQASLNNVSIHDGQDAEESSIEALYQGLTGLGYDQNSDGVYSSTTDILPFQSQAADSFDGNVEGSNDPTTPGTGTIGGFGFREGALPVIIYATDTAMRDPDQGYMSPPTANHTAGSTDVVHACDDIGARLIGVATQYNYPVPQMNDLAQRTGSLYDSNGDGINDTPLVFQWNHSSEAFRNTIVEAVENLLGSVRFDTVSAQVAGNTYGFDVVVDPPLYTNVAVGNGIELDFQVLIMGEVAALPHDQSFPMTLEIYGDDSTLLGTKDVTVVVPGVPN